MNTVEIEHLSLFYGRKQALQDVNLSLGRGMYGLLGRNGAGKTTLMKTIATLLPVKEGKVSVCGVPAGKPAEIRKIIGYLPQDFSMYPGMSVKEAMDYLGVLSGMGAAERKKRSDMLLRKVNLEEQKNKKVRALSGGMRRRLGIAQALLHNPKVLIVDEPTAGLDPEERIRFRNLLCEVAEERTVILSTHIAGDIEATCEKIGILNEGRLLYNGTVEGLLKEAEGKVCTMAAGREELLALKKQYSITEMHTQGGKTFVRFLTQEGQTPEGAISCEPGIEDAYMLYLHRNGTDTEALGGGC